MTPNKVLATKLKLGDTIAVVSPSSPVTNSLHTQLQAGTKALETLGFKVKLAPHALSNTLGYSATAQEKTDDINKMFADDTVKAIFCSQGGQNANSVLPLLDYELIRRNPKIFFGISDISVLLNGIFAKTGLVTFHGNDVIWGFGRGAARYELDAIRRTLIEAQTGPIPKNSTWRTIRGHGSVSGTLLGGNITCLGKIIGTEYLPDFNDAIVFLEDYGEETTADKTSYTLHHLDQAGVLKQIKGLVLGYYKTIGDMQLESIAEEVTAKYSFPIIQTNDFGHNTPNAVLPVGSHVTLDVDKAVLSLDVPYLK